MIKRATMLAVVAAILGSAAVATAQWDPNTDPSLVGWWKFDDGAGTTAQDSSGKAHNGTLQSSPQWVAGRFGGALSFNSSNYVQVNYAADLALNEFTVCTWVNLAAEPTESGVLGTRSSGENTFDFKVETAQIHGDIGTGTAWLNTAIDITASNTGTKGQGGDLEVGTWYMIAYVIDNKNQQVRLYLDGDLKRTIAISGTPLLMQSGAGESMLIGGTGYAGEGMNGLIDDVRIYGRALTTAEIKALVPPKLKARKPSPADGATTVMLPLFTWTPGETALFEDVYLGTSPDLTAANRVSTHQSSMLKMYYHMVPPLVEGQKYYWRIDDFDAAAKVFTGDLWSFTVWPFTASVPKPADGATGEFPGLTLTWQKGKNAKSNHVYFGADQTAVANANASTDGGTVDEASFTTPALRVSTPYYWRVDTVNIDGTVAQGKVWSFTTADAGPANKIKFEAWMGITGTAVANLTGSARYPENPDVVEYLDTWVHPVGATGAVDWKDYYGSRMYGWLMPPETGDYTFWIAGDDEQQLWLSTDDGIANAVQIANVSGWTPALDFDNTGGGVGGASQKSEPITLQAGKKYLIMTLAKEGNGGDSTAVAWQGGPIAAREVIKGQYISSFSLPPLQAFSPTPTNGEIDTLQTLTLTWSGGEKAQEHAVYFGNDANAVAAADTSSPLFKGQQADTSFDVSALDFNETYYWRVDEINAGEADSPWKGKVWSFTTANYIKIDNFESYTNDSPNRLFQTWIDGWGFSPDESFPDGNAGNGTGASVGHDIWTAGTPYTYIVETSIVHTGNQSMPLDYNNVNSPFNSEAERTWTAPQNWTSSDVKILSLWFHGCPAKLVDQGNGAFTVGASGSDIYGTADNFRFVYKRLNGNGSITAKVESLVNTNPYAKAGVMIRETLEAGSMYAIVPVSPSNGTTFEYRSIADGSAASVVAWTGGTIKAPYWVRLTRTGDVFKAETSPDGKTWTALGTDQTIVMGTNAYIGLCLTSHDATLTTMAEFSGVAPTGGVTGAWQQAWIGSDRDLTNDPDQLYVVLQDSSNKSAVVNHPDGVNAVLASDWTEWQIPLSQFTGVNATKIKKMIIGVGNHTSPVKDGAGSLFIDDIRLIRATP